MSFWGACHTVIPPGQVGCLGKKRLSSKSKLRKLDCPSALFDSDSFHSYDAGINTFDTANVRCDDVVSVVMLILNRLTRSASPKGFLEELSRNITSLEKKLWF